MRSCHSNISSSQITFPTADQLRARKVILTSNNKHVGKIQSIKCGRTMYLDSVNEYHQGIIFEIDPTVIIFFEQPFKLEYLDEDGDLRLCYPDFLVYYDDGRVVVVEVKGDKDAELPEIKRKFELEKIALEQHGYGFRVVTESEITNGLLLENSRKLMRYRRETVGAKLRMEVLATLREHEMTGRELLTWVLPVAGYFNF